MNDGNCTQYAKLSRKTGRTGRASQMSQLPHPITDNRVQSQIQETLMSLSTEPFDENQVTL